VLLSVAANGVGAQIIAAGGALTTVDADFDVME
jgi:hypothetical protein